MATSPDFKARMANTMAATRHQGAAVASTSAVDKFAAAQAAMKKFPEGYANPEAPDLQGTRPGNELIEVELNLVDDNPYNARRIYEASKIAALGARIAVEGQTTAALAFRTGDRFTLVDGGYRKRALAAIGRSTIRLEVRGEPDALTMYLLSWSCNANRTDQTALDNALAWKGLIDDGLVKSGEQIAERLGVSPATVSRTLTMLKLQDEVMELIRLSPHKFPYSICAELVLIQQRTPIEDVLNLVNRVAKDELSRRELTAIRETLENPKPRKKNETSRQYKLGTGSLKEWDNGSVRFEIKIEDPTQRAALVEELKLRFGSTQAQSGTIPGATPAPLAEKSPQDGVSETQS